ncbi:hypothetical protein [Mycolicibacterium peregrinum]
MTELFLKVVLEPLDGGWAEHLPVQPDADIMQLLKRQEGAQVP